MSSRSEGLFLGFKVDPASMEETSERFLLKSSHLTTHGVIIGMTGSGKTGAAIVLIEELLLQGVPVIAIDPKGDLANLALRFPNLSPGDFAKWVDPSAARAKGLSTEEYATRVAEMWRKGLLSSGIGPERLRKLADSSEVLILTPGSDAGTPVSILGELEAPKDANDEVLEEKSRTMAAALLRLMDVEEGGDEEVFLANLMLWAWRRGEKLTFEKIVRYTMQPPFDKIGVLDIDMVLPEKKRRELAIRLNRILASPGFEDWLKGLPLDIDSLLWSPEGKPRAVVLYLAHLDDKLKMFAATLMLQAVYAWMYRKGGTDRLRTLIYFDEVYGFIPPYPANPPSKRLLMLLTKQGRAFGVGVVLATQNPVDIDYKVLTNAGVWMIGRLQTENDIERVAEGLRVATGSGEEARKLIPRLPKRTFVVKNVKARGLSLFKTRWAMTYLRGPMTLQELRRLPRRAEEKTRAIPQSSVPQEADIGEKLLHAPPLVYRDFDQAFLGKTGPGVARYKPVLYGKASVYISKSRPPISLEKTVTAASKPSTGPLSFKAPSQLGLPKDALQKASTTPPENSLFENLPSTFTKRTIYTKVKAAFTRYVIEKSTITLLYHPKLKIYSNPGETEQEFRQRIARILNEKLAELSEKIASKYDSKLERIKRRVESKKARIERLRGEISNLKAELGLAGASALASLTRLSSIASKISRAQSLRRRIASKEATLRQYQQELESLEREYQRIQEEKREALAKLKKQLESVNLRRVTVKPSRKNVDIEFLGILWVPDQSQESYT